MLVTVMVVMVLAYAAKAQMLHIEQVTMVTFQGNPGATYDVEYSTSLAPDAVWTHLETVVANESGGVKVFDNPHGSNRFYRSLLLDLTPRITLRTSPIFLSNSSQISRTNPTRILIGAFDIKVSHANGTMHQIDFDLHGTTGLTNLFSEVMLVVGNVEYPGSQSAVFDNQVDGYVLFSNMNIALLDETWVTLKVYGTIKPDTFGWIDGSKVSVSVRTGDWPDGVNNPDVDDASNKSINVASNIISGNTTTLLSGAAYIASGSTTVGAAVIVNNEVASYPITFQFTIGALSQEVYIARPLANAISVQVEPDATFTPAVGTASPESFPGDSETEFVIPAGGSRTFTFTGTMKGDGTHEPKAVGVQDIYLRAPGFEFDQYDIMTGLDPLSAVVQF
jgi:hypothetical protein